MRILLADGQARVRFALRVLLARQAGLEVVGEASDAQSLISMVDRTGPDVVLLAWDLPGLDRIGGVVALKERHPVHVIALSGHPDAQPSTVAAGADAFVSKGEPPERLLGVIETYRQKGRRAAGTH
jgi:DNA-binding NarL/FixJ family response regulator